MHGVKGFVRGMECEIKSSLPHVTLITPSPDHREIGSGLSLLPSPSPALPGPGERGKSLISDKNTNVVVSDRNRILFRCVFRVHHRV